MASRTREPDLSYLPAAVDRIAEQVSEARRPWQQPADRAKIVVDATYDAARTLAQLGVDPVWTGLSRQQRRLLQRLGRSRAVLTSDLLVELGYDQQDAESLVDAVNHVLRAYAENPYQSRDPEPARVAQQTIQALAAVTLTLANEADQNIAHRQQREAWIGKLLGLLELVVQILINVAVSIAVSLLFADMQPQWASSILQSVDELRTGLGEVGLWLLTFTAAEQGARLAVEVAYLPAWSAAKLGAFARPDWRPLSGAGNPVLIQQLDELRKWPGHGGQPPQTHVDPMVKAPDGRRHAARPRPGDSPRHVLQTPGTPQDASDGPGGSLRPPLPRVRGAGQPPRGPTKPGSPGVGPRL